MKKRDLFWLKRVLIILFVGLIFVWISLHNIAQFNQSYIQEEKHEMEVFKKQIEWVAVPLLKKSDIKTLEKYALDFWDDKEFAFKIFDSNKNLLVSSDNEISTEQYLQKQYEINIDGKPYYIEVDLSQGSVMNAIVKAQNKIMILFGLGIFCLILGLIQIFYSVRKSFNTLEDSVIQIARGDFDVSIELPKNGLLNELSLAIMRMTNRLKNQITRLTQLEEYRKEFVSNMSHEIKTPITAINSAVELIEGNSETTAIQKECFDIIKSQTYSINRLVGDILTLSEIDLEKTNEHKNFKVFNLNNAIHQAISIQPQEVIFNQSESINVLGNEELVITLITNLLSNAIKYSGSDKIEVNLTNDKNIIIEVKDCGVGIPDEHLPRIFERFYRVDKTRSRQSGGTGLGLAIVKHIAELHNWKIEVESKVGVGTSFRIII